MNETDGKHCEAQEGGEQILVSEAVVFKRCRLRCLKAVKGRGMHLWRGGFSRAGLGSRQPLKVLKEKQ